jgi:hypothetical protein
LRKQKKGKPVLRIIDVAWRESIRHCKIHLIFAAKKTRDAPFQLFTPIMMLLDQKVFSTQDDRTYWQWMIEQQYVVCKLWMQQTCKVCIEHDWYRSSW